MSLTNIQSRHIQILRGLSIIAVVFIHTSPTGITQVFIRPFLNFSVGMFLFLSGILSKNTSWNPKKRLVKVLVPYVIWTFIYVCMKNFNSFNNIPFDLFKSLLLADSVAIMYYIFVYCQFTLLIPLIDKIANSKYKYWGFIISPIEILIMRTLPVIIGYQNNIYLQKIINVSCLGWFTYFYLGYLIGNKKLTIKHNNISLFISLAISICLQMLEGYWFLTLGHNDCGTQLKLTSILAGSFFVLLGYKFIKSETLFTCKLLYALGDYSFGIYFSHLAFIKIFNLIPLFAKYIIYPFSTTIVIIISFLTCYIGKRILKKYSWLIGL